MGGSLIEDKGGPFKGTKGAARNWFTLICCSIYLVCADAKKNSLQDACVIV